MHLCQIAASFRRGLFGRAAMIVAALLFAMSGQPARAVDDVYMFSYFKDPDGVDGMHLAYSLDGMSFHAVNNDVAITGPMAGTSTRDPNITFGPDGKFHLVHTTLPFSPPSSRIAYGESTDLITWTNKKYIDVMGAYPNTQLTWAPETIYDAANSRYMMYWSADQGSGFRTYYTTTTDFNTFAPTSLLYDPGRSVIDASIVKDGANYVMFVKDEFWNPNTLFVYKAQGGTSVTGPYATTGPQITPSDHPFEAPTGIKIGDRWFMYGDYFTDSPQKMGLFTSDDDMGTWTERTNQVVFPAGTKHGTIFKVPRAVADNLISNGALLDTNEIEFDGQAGTSNYLTGGNWLGNAVPGSGQIPVIQNGNTVELSSTPAGTLAGLHVGRTSSGTLVVSGTTALNVNGIAEVGGLNNPNVVGALRMSGGSIGLTSPLQVGNGAIYLDGGTMLTPSVVGNGEGTAAFHFNGGTLRARNSTTAFMTEFDTVAVEAGGAVIDTNGFDVTIPQPLASASATGGLTKNGAGVLTFTAANIYSGATTISQGILRLDAPAGSVAHRWSFNGSLVDSVGGSNATIVNVGANNVTLSSTEATLAGGARNASDYISLGSNLLPDTNTAVTIELWATQESLQNWSRIFDFGAGSNENLFISWTHATNLNSDRVEWKDGATTTSDGTNQPYDLGTEYHIVMELNPQGSSTAVTWYSAASGDADLGAAQGSFVTTNTLANFADSANNLGRSFYSADATANASYNEVRLWDGTLGSSILEILHDAGPDANLNTLNFGDPGSLPSTTAVNITGIGAALDLNNFNQTIASLSGVAGSNVVLGSGVLTTGGGNTSTTYAGVISGSGGITKIGTGTQTLSGTNSYTGVTTVQQGSLVLGIDAHGPVLSDAGDNADVQGGRLIFDYSGGGSVGAQVQAILDGGNDLATPFSSGKIYTSNTPDGSQALGWMDDTTAMQVRVAWTWKGDTNLDGMVTIADLGELASNWQSTTAVWGEGDFNYDGQVTISDLGDLASNWQAGVGNPMAMSFADALAAAGLRGVSVPEPAMAMLGILGAWPLKRRPRRGV